MADCKTAFVTFFPISPNNMGSSAVVNSRFKSWPNNKKIFQISHISKINNGQCKTIFINKEVPINLINLFQKKIIKNFKYFLFISSSHVYGFHKKKIMENDKRKPFNKYGNSKKNVEDFIIKNKKKFYFKIGIARIFNFTSNKQNYGHFVPDMYSKIKNRKNLINLNINRDFIHIDDVTRSLELMIKKQIDKPINIWSGKKIN